MIVLCIVFKIININSIVVIINANVKIKLNESIKEMILKLKLSSLWTDLIKWDAVNTKKLMSKVKESGLMRLQWSHEVPKHHCWC